MAFVSSARGYVKAELVGEFFPSASIRQVLVRVSLSEVACFTAAGSQKSSLAGLLAITVNFGRCTDLFVRTFFVTVYDVNAMSIQPTTSELV